MLLGLGLRALGVSMCAVRAGLWYIYIIIYTCTICAYVYARVPDFFLVLEDSILVKLILLRVLNGQNNLKPLQCR